MSQRIIDFFDGNESGTQPVIGNITASDLVVYADDAAYEADNAGAPQIGNIYYNSTSNVVRYYNGSTWITVGTEDAVDANFQIRDDVDPTKAIQFQVSGVSAGQTRIITVPDANTNLVRDNLSNLTSTSINQSLIPDGDGTRNIGSSTFRWNVVYANTLQNPSTGGTLTIQALDSWIEYQSPQGHDFYGQYVYHAANSMLWASTAAENIASFNIQTTGFNINTENGNGSYNAVPLNINSGAGGSGLNQNGAAISITTGAGDGTGNSGATSRSTGNGGASNGNSGSINDTTGTPNGSGDSGDINQTTGDADSGDSGSIKRQVGTSSSGARGRLKDYAPVTEIGPDSSNVYEREFKTGITLNDSETDTEITELTIDASVYRSVKLTYTMVGDLGEVKFGELYVVHNGTNAFSAGPSAEESGIDVTLDADIDGTDLIITYTSGANGATMDVKIERYLS